MLLLVLLDPAVLLAVSVTVKVPIDEKTCAGCCWVLVTPSPKSHDQEVGPPVVASVNCTFWFDSGVVGENEKAATGELTDGVLDCNDEDIPVPQPAAAMQTSINIAEKMTLLVTIAGLLGTAIVANVGYGDIGWTITFL